MDDIYEIILELTLPQLYKSAVDAFPDTTKRQHSTDVLNVKAMQFVPYKNHILIKAVVVNQNDGHKYDCQVRLAGVKYVSEDGPNVITFTGTDGVQYHIEQISKNAEAKVRCNCLDFYWRFATWDANKQALIGRKPAPYVKKTNRPPANPKQMPGICKHIMCVIEEIDNSNLTQ